MTTFQVMHAPQVYDHPKAICKICRDHIEIGDLRMAEDMAQFPAWHHIKCFQDDWGNIKGNRDKLRSRDQIHFRPCCTEADRDIIEQLFVVSLDQSKAISQARAPLTQNLEAFARASTVPMPVCPATPEQVQKTASSNISPQILSAPEHPLPTAMRNEERPVVHIEPLHLPTEEQLAIINAIQYLARGGTTEKWKMRVTAGPGTGKTETIVNALVALDAASAHGVILPAFSKAATDTLNTRLRSHNFPASADPARTLHSITANRLGFHADHPIIDFGGTKNLIFPKEDEKFIKKQGTPQLCVRFDQEVQDAAINVLGSALAESCKKILSKMCEKLKGHVTKKFEMYLQCTEPDLMVFLRQSFEKASKWEGQDAYLQRMFTQMCEKLSKEIRQKCTEGEVLNSWVAQFKNQLPLLCESVLPRFWNRYVDWSSDSQYRDNQTGETTFFWTHDMKPKAVHIQFLKQQQLSNPSSSRLTNKDDSSGIVIVDEAQDLTSLQFDLIEKLFPNKSVLVVGDPVQSINGFRGAEPWMFETTFQPSISLVPSAGEDATSVVPKNYDLRLSTTFRFGSKIADIHNRFLQLRHKSCLEKGRKMPSHCFQINSLNHGGFVGVSPQITTEGLQRFLISDALPKFLDSNAQQRELCFIGRNNASALQVALKLIELTASHPKEIGNRVKLQLKLKEPCIKDFCSKYFDLLAFLIEKCDSNGEALGFGHPYFKDTAARFCLRGRLTGTPKSDTVEGLENYADWWSLVHNHHSKKRGDTKDEDEDDEDVSLLPEGALSVVQHIHNALLAAADLDRGKNEPFEEAATRDPQLVLHIVNRLYTVVAILEGRTNKPFYSASTVAAAPAGANSGSTSAEGRVTLSVSISHQAKGKEVQGVVVLEDEFSGCPVADPSSSVPGAITTATQPTSLFGPVLFPSATAPSPPIAGSLPGQLQTLRSDDLGTFYVAMTRAKEFLWIPRGMWDVSMDIEQDEDEMGFSVVPALGDENEEGNDVEDQGGDPSNSSLSPSLNTTQVYREPDSSRGKRSRDE